MPTFPRTSMRRRFIAVATMVLVAASLAVSSTAGVMRAAAASGTNVAYQKTVTAEAGVWMANPQYATDGILNTSYYTNLGSGPVYIVIDLGQNYQLGELRFWHYYADGRTYHDVIAQLSQYSNFSSLTTVFNNDTNNSAGQGTGSNSEYAESSAGKDVALSTPVTARYLRLWTNGSTVNAFNHCVEVQAFASASPAPTPSATPTPTPTPSPSPTSCPPTIQQGSTGSTVVLLQQQLNVRGYHLLVDGDFGPITKAAVIDFQMKKGLTANGIDGDATWQALGQCIVHHYEYVFPDGSMYVYDMDNNHALVSTTSLPTTAGVRGVAASAATGMLYVSYGGDAGGKGNGSMLEYDLVHKTVVYTRSYPFGIDSMDISPDGKTIYIPTGELSSGNVWEVIDASTGNPITTMTGGSGPHNTVTGPTGAHVYMGGRNDTYLVEGDAVTHAVIKKIGPLKPAAGVGVRPFTINHAETMAFTTATGFLGFQVSSITTGQLLYTVPVPGFSIPSGFPYSTPSHGIAVSPDEKEIWLVDSANDYVHVFDVSGLPSLAPRDIADVNLQGSFGGNESPCAYDCGKDGWINMSRDGRFVYVGDAGDVINRSTRQTIMVLSTLANTRKHLEIDWSNGAVVNTWPRESLGYASTTPTPIASATATP